MAKFSTMYNYQPSKAEELDMTRVCDSDEFEDTKTTVQRFFSAGVPPDAMSEDSAYDYVSEKDDIDDDQDFEEQLCDDPTEFADLAARRAEEQAATSPELSTVSTGEADAAASIKDAASDRVDSGNGASGQARTAASDRVPKRAKKARQSDDLDALDED